MFYAINVATMVAIEFESLEDARDFASKEPKSIHVLCKSMTTIVT